MQSARGIRVIRAIRLCKAVAAGALTFAGGFSPNVAAQPALADLTHLSLEELANIAISSVSRRAEPLSDAAASVYVITSDDIRRSGATSLAEALRLAPNLQVARVDASQYAISARGFNSTTANKLQVLIDGRSVYTPLFSGVFWDVQDVLLEDIDRIEVISGPAGVLWGSNAVNGVINVITRSSRSTHGGLVSLGAGNRSHDVSARYGSTLGADAAYRIYAKGFERQATERADASSAEDGWNKVQAGLRLDWKSSADALTLQGDVYEGSIDQLVNADKTLAGGNLVARWNRELGGGSALQVQGYYDRTRRVYPGTFGEVLQTYDLDVQHRLAWGNHELVWGGGYRTMRDDVTNTAALAFLPARKTLKLANVFIQDTIALGAPWRLTLGAKLENNSYTGNEFQPGARLAYKLADAGLVWGAVSRAVRTPSRLDRELFLPGSAPFVIAGGPDFASEKLTAYELGYRAAPSPRASFSIATFYNVYRSLRSIEPTGSGSSELANKMEGHTRGFETSGSYRATERWRLHAGYSYLRRDLHFASDSGDTGRQNAGNDPAYQLSLRSSLNLPHNLELDVGLRAVGELPNPRVPRYTVLDARLGWTLAKQLQLALVATGLNDPRHPEFGAPATRSEIGRAVLATLTWSFAP